MSEQSLPEVRVVADDEFDWSAETGPAAEVRRITAAADATDGVVNLNEAACLHLKNRGLADATLYLAEQGYALLYAGTFELVVDPAHRGQGFGTALATHALDGYTAEVNAWAHGDHPAAARIADRFGLRRDRELWVMQRPLDDTLAPVGDTPGYRIRTFREGDEAGLLEVNSLAFSHHPEQGHMTLEDFRERQAESWYDDAGLFLAVDPDEKILGFHWTKVHRDEGVDPVGEVYVVAVDPRTAGRGIGKVLTAAGLLHLRDLGLGTVILYVDGDNAPAIAVYEGAGFSTLRIEAQYRGTPPA